MSKVLELSAKKANHSLRQGAFATLVQYCDHFRETNRLHKETCPDLNISDKEQAMNFFNNNCYGSYKASMINGWASKAIDVPDTVILIYCLAGS
jgi:thiaminase